MKVEVINAEDPIIFDALVAGVREYNFENMGREQAKHLTVIARDEKGKLIAGVSGRTIYQQFLINVVWVDKDNRGTGLGRLLMEQAEVEAKQQGCVAAQVDTLSFQAPGFYRKLGFEVVGKVTGFIGHPERYFFVKKYQC